DPGLGNMFSDQNRYNMVTDAMRLKRMENWSSYITSPDKVPPKQPGLEAQVKVQEAKTKDKAADAAMVTAQANALKNEKNAEVAALKEQLKEMELHVKALMQWREQKRQDADTANRINVSQREIALAEKYPPHKEPSGGPQA